MTLASSLPRLPPEQSTAWSLLVRTLRFPVRLPMTLKGVGGALEGTTRNISSRGMCVCVASGAALPPIDSVLELTCQAPDQTLALQVRVVWAQAKATNHRGEARAWLGLELADPSTASGVRLAGFASALRVHVLAVTDDAEQAAFLERIIGGQYPLRQVQAADDALALIDAQEFGVVLAGPTAGCSGAALLEQVSSRFPDDLSIKLCWGEEPPGGHARASLFWQLLPRIPTPHILRSVIDGAIQHYWARAEPKLYFHWSQHQATGGHSPVAAAASPDSGALRRMPLFEGMSDEAFEAARARLRPIRRRRGERLFEAGDAGDAMYVLRSGEARVLASVPGGGERVLRHVGPGATVGEMALLLDQPRSASVEMSVDGELLVLSKADLDALLREHPEVAVFLSRELARRLSAPLGAQEVELRLLAVAGYPLAANLAWTLERLGLSVVLLSADGRLPEGVSRRPAVVEEPIQASEDGLVRRLGELLALFDRVVVALPETGVGHAPKVLELADALIAREGRGEPWHLRARRQLSVRGEALGLERLARRIAKRTVGLALSSGGAWGIAHVGVLQVLHEEGVPVDLVAGASAGALFGALFCAGWSIVEMRRFAREELARAVKLRSGLLDVGRLPFSGLVRGQKLRDWLNERLGGRGFDQLRTPLHVVCADVTQGCERVLARGSVADAVRASIGVPGVFAPWRVGDAFLVDGGMVNPLPISVLQEHGADLIIASSVTGAAGLAGSAHPPRPPSYMQQLVSLMAAMEGETLKVRRPRIDVLVRPAVGHFSLVDYDRAEALLEAGVRAAREHLEALGVVKRKSSLESPPL